MTRPKPAHRIGVEYDDDETQSIWKFWKADSLSRTKKFGDKAFRIRER
jgi:hypothetical protein